MKMVKNTVTLDSDAQDTIDELADKHNLNKVDVFRKLVDIAGHADDLDGMEQAVKQYKDVSLTDYDPAQSGNIDLSRSQLRDIGTPQLINPDHVSPSNMPQAHDNKAMVIICMMMYDGHISDTGINTGVVSNYVSEYVGVSHTDSEKLQEWKRMLTQLYKTHQESEQVSIANLVRQYSKDKFDDEKVEKLAETQGVTAEAARIVLES